MEKSIFSERLKILMNKNGTTQKELADFTGISRQAIALYMDGSVQPNVDRLCKITNFFNISADYLIGIETENEKNMAMLLEKIEKLQLKLKMVRKTIDED